MESIVSNNDMEYDRDLLVSLGRYSAVQKSTIVIANRHNSGTYFFDLHHARQLSGTNTGLLVPNAVLVELG